MVKSFEKKIHTFWLKCIVIPMNATHFLKGKVYHIYLMWWLIYFASASSGSRSRLTLCKALPGFFLCDFSSLLYPPIYYLGSFNTSYIIFLINLKIENLFFYEIIKFCEGKNIEYFLKYIFCQNENWFQNRLIIGQTYMCVWKLPKYCLQY
jgi:hypothetical protein